MVRNTESEEENKVRCGICKKLFRGTEFIRRHIQTKHEENVNAIVKDRIETIMLENYVNDPDKLSNQIAFASDSYRGIDRRKVYPKKRVSQETPYEDLDDPSRFNRSRNAVDYSDI